MTGFKPQEFDGNPEPRCACMLLLDTSGSMDGEPIRQLNEGLAQFERELKNNDLARLRVEVGIITFGNGGVNCQQEFVTADNFIAPILSANGATPMGGAVNLAINKIEERKTFYKTSGLDYYRPWIFMITDGGPTDGEIWKQAASMSKSKESAKGVAFFSVGVQGADMEVLKTFSNRPPVLLKGLAFSELFQWLSKSMAKVSESKPGDQVSLNPIESWATV